MIPSACASGPPEWSVARVEGAVEVRADRPITAVEVVAADGTPVTRRDGRGPVVSVALTPPPGATWRVRASFAGGWVDEATVAGPPLPVTVAVEIPAGQGRREVVDGDVISAWVGPDARASVVLTAVEPARASVRWGDEAWDVPLSTPGEQVAVPIPLAGEVDVAVGAGGHEVRMTLRPRTLDPASALTVTGAWLPSDPVGDADPTRPADRIRVDPPWFGPRPPDDAPVTWHAVGLANATDAPIDVVVRASVEDRSGAPLPAFRSRARGQEDQPFVSVVVRVPANGAARAALPLYVDRAMVHEPVEGVRRVAVIPLGAAAPVHELRAPLAVDRSGRAAPLGFAAALAASAVGWAGVIAGHRAFLARTRTTELVTIGLFAGATFVVGAAFQLVGLAIAAVLGPFAPLFTGLFDDGFRAVLLATLLTLSPRPGVFAAVTAVGFVLRALALGGVHPTDLVYVGAVIATHEASLYAFGPTRGLGGAARLALGLGVANAACVVLGLATSATLYRLYYAGWYVAALASVPGFLYVALGCVVAAPIARSLARVAP